MGKNCVASFDEVYKGACLKAESAPSVILRWIIIPFQEEPLYLRWGHIVQIRHRSYLC